MTQVCSLSSSAASANALSDKRLPKGINIIGTDKKTVSGVGDVPAGKQTDNYHERALPWGYIHIQHMTVEAFEQRLNRGDIEGDFCPKCFVHRTMRYKQAPNGRGVKKLEVQTISGLVFLQGTTEQLRKFLRQNFPQYFLVKNCSTGSAASIPHSVMQPFMDVMRHDPARITFLRDPFVKFARDHVRLRVLTGPFKGQEGYVVRVHRDRQLVMDFGGYAVAVSNVHNEDFEVAE